LSTSLILGSEVRSSTSWSHSHSRPYLHSTRRLRRPIILILKNSLNF
jgi:hypothetical protein